jgi:hypothetical protein
MKHLLKEHGILTSFNIRQILTTDELADIYKNIESKTQNPTEIQRRFAVEMDKRSIQNIPGTIPPNQAQLRLKELLDRSILISNFIQKDEMTKKELIILINFIAKNLGVGGDSSD